MQMFDGTLLQDENNINWAYFDDPVFNERLHAAKQLVGDARYDAFRQIEHDLVRDAAPWAAMRTYNNRDLFSRRIGCQLYNAPVRQGPISPTFACDRRSRSTTP